MRLRKMSIAVEHVSVLLTLKLILALESSGATSYTPSRLVRISHSVAAIVAVILCNSADVDPLINVER
jgi:hypothetical protein